MDDSLNKTKQILKQRLVKVFSNNSSEPLTNIGKGLNKRKEIGRLRQDLIDWRPPIYKALCLRYPRPFRFRGLQSNRPCTVPIVGFGTEKPFYFNKCEELLLVQMRTMSRCFLICSLFRK